MAATYPTSARRNSPLLATALLVAFVAAAAGALGLLLILPLAFGLRQAIVLARASFALSALAVLLLALTPRTDPRSTARLAATKLAACAIVTSMVIAGDWWWLAH
jgi:hypothetical protein